MDCSLISVEEICDTAVECVWEEEACINITIVDPAPVDPILPPEELEPSINQVIQITEAGEGWEPSALQTYGTKFLIRGKEALTWSLNIEDAGFHNEAIQTSYVKVLTIVNSLFILGLLAIAAMWMFSIVIPRKYLKEVILYFAIAVIFVNFALPITRLFIDSTNLLQKTLLTQDGTRIAITDIVQTPSYEDAVGYENLTAEDSIKELSVSLTDDSAITEIVVGKVDGPTREIDGTISGEPAGSINLTMSATDDQSIKLNTNQTIKVTSASKFHPETEHSIFSFLLIVATGIAYFILALIFVLRIIILWALLILSPILVLLGIFKLTRGWFYNWLAIYGKWLFIGPLVALGIAVIVNIWKTVGLPITVNEAFVGETFSVGNVSNISFLLPGKTIPNTLSTTSEMMEYLVFLMMLYIPIFFGFALTRHKNLKGVAVSVVERFRDRRHTPITVTETEGKEMVTKGAITESGVLGTLKGMFTGKMAQVTNTAIPGAMKTEKTPVIPSASSFLPEQLATTDLHGILGLLGVNKDSRNSRDLAISGLANPEALKDPKEKEQFKSARNEVERRANIVGQPEAIILLNEIKEKETSAETTESKTTEKEGRPQTVGEAMEYVAEQHGETGTTPVTTSTVERTIETKEKETVVEKKTGEAIKTQSPTEKEDMEEDKTSEEEEDNTENTEENTEDNNNEKEKENTKPNQDNKNE